MTNEAVLSTKKKKHLITEKIQKAKEVKKTQLTRFAVTCRPRKALPFYNKKRNTENTYKGCTYIHSP